MFEPNDEPLWAQIRLNVGAFMHNLFRQGAFQGTTPREAYFVKCDKETTTQNDINLGIVNILVGFAPLKPAEFVVIKIQQIAGQIADLRRRAMAQFSVNAQRFDPYKNFKFRVKWDGRYVAGVSKVSALKRTTEVVEHREGGDPEHAAASRPAAPKYEADHARARRHPRHRVREVGEQGLELRRRARRRGRRSRTSARTSSSRSTTRPGSWRSPTRSSAAGSRSTRRCPISTPTPTRSRSRHIKLENEGWERDYDVTEPTEPTLHRAARVADGRRLEVRVPGGIIADDDRLMAVALRRLSGRDQEALLGLAGAPAAHAAHTLLDRCLQSIGGRAAHDGAVAELTIGDREAILWHLRSICFGDRIAAVVECPQCHEKLDIDLSVAGLLQPTYPRWTETFTEDVAGHRIKFRRCRRSPIGRRRSGRRESRRGRSTDTAPGGAFWRSTGTPAPTRS